jgi:hypothetical protein
VERTHLVSAVASHLVNTLATQKSPVCRITSAAPKCSATAGGQRFQHRVACVSERTPYRALLLGGCAHEEPPPCVAMGRRVRARKGTGPLLVATGGLSDDTWMRSSVNECARRHRRTYVGGHVSAAYTAELQMTQDRRSPQRSQRQHRSRIVLARFSLRCHGGPAVRSREPGDLEQAPLAWDAP